MDNYSNATFGLQCFWGAEVKYATVKGVISTRVGYTGGSTTDPTYRNLSDHTEAVDVKFDPKAISYQEMLNIFWRSHDPTFQTKQQYMSAIFYNNEEQRLLAEKSLKEVENNYSQPIATKILPLNVFYNAENYHQKYFLRKNKTLIKELDLSDEQIISSEIATRLNGFCAGFGSVEQFENELKDLKISMESKNLIKELIGSGPNLGEC